MASTQHHPSHVLLSPAELAYLHDALLLVPPIRPDGRGPNDFRPLVAETGILPGANGSARICFADGTEAIAGVKAEVERTVRRAGDDTVYLEEGGGEEEDVEEGEEVEEKGKGRGEKKGEAAWVELTVEIPGVRDDDSGTVFLAAMLSEALLADGELVGRLWINRRFHWKLYIDIILISPPLSYPLPLLSLTTHLALLSTRLPRLKSEGDEDPFFDDDWAAAPYLFPRSSSSKSQPAPRPPITLLVMAVGNNILFDPSKEELAVADVALAVSVTSSTSQTGKEVTKGKNPSNSPSQSHRSLRLLSIRTIDPPSRLTPPGVANAANAAYGAANLNNLGNNGQQQKAAEARTAETEAVEGVWRAPRGGANRAVLAALVGKVLEKGGIVDEVLDALEAVDLG
ncbi:hypothetical protein VTJ49DRAFT_1324 [Mycothermus thermophilus]|uniref:Ribosomal RNA-processing protein 42 n=1 Tax=Humicola insolens TaxID=85995 RepID=A0ABR3VDY7_HUMIN